MFINAKIIRNRNYTSLFLHLLKDSTLIYIITNFIVNFLMNLGFFVVSDYYNLDPIMKYPNITFGADEIRWKREIVTGVYSTGLVVGFVLSIIFIMLLLPLRRKSHLLRLILIWFSINSVAVFSTYLITTPLSNSFIGGVLAWNRFNYPLVKILMSIIGAVVMIIFSLYISLPIFRLAFANRFVSSGSERINFLKASILYPFLIGTIPTIILNFPIQDIFSFLLPITIGLIVGLIMISSSLINKVIIVKKDEYHYISFSFYISILFLLVIIRLLLLTPIKI